MLKSVEEVNQANELDPTVVNGIDNPNLESIDSTEPIKLVVESVDEDGKVVVGNQKSGDLEEEKEKEKEQEEKPAEEKEEEKKENLEDEDLDYSARVQKRIGGLTKKMRKAERERDSERKKREELEKKIAELTAKETENAKPKKEDFEEEDEYIEALMDWKADVRAIESQKTSLEESEEESEENVEDADEDDDSLVEQFVGLDAAMEKGKAKHDDFEEKVLDENLVLSSEVAKMVLETDLPEDIMYHLASNPKESAKISSLSEIKAAREIGKLEIKLTSETKETPKPQSKAPAPIKPVKASAPVDKSPEDMSAAEYRAWREGKK